MVLAVIGGKPQGRTMNKSAIFCEHANEVPVSCPCDDDCYCKEHTCKPRLEEQIKKINKELAEDLSSTIQIQHGERFSTVILSNSEADIWCEINRLEGNNRQEMANEVYESVLHALYFERQKALNEN